MCHEILTLSNTFIETPNILFDNTTYWGILPCIITKLTSDLGDTSNETATLSKLTLSVFDKNY